MNYTIVTSDEQEAALAWSYKEAQKGVSTPGLPPQAPPPQTQAEYLQANVNQLVLNPMVQRHQTAKNAELVSMVATIPPENQDAALAEIEDVIVDHGGTVPLRDVPYLWSTNTAAPPRNNSVEADQTQANIATMTKLTAHYLDSNNVDRMNELMAIAVGSTIRVDDPAAPGSALVVRLTTAPIQRQGANGYVEFLVQFVQFSGTFLDTQPVRFGVE